MNIRQIIKAFEQIVSLVHLEISKLAIITQIMCTWRKIHQLIWIYKN